MSLERAQTAGLAFAARVQCADCRGKRAVRTRQWEKSRAHPSKSAGREAVSAHRRGVYGYIAEVDARTVRLAGATGRSAPTGDRSTKTSGRAPLQRRGQASRERGQPKHSGGQRKQSSGQRLHGTETSSPGAPLPRTRPARRTDGSAGHDYAPRKDRRAHRTFSRKWPRRAATLVTVARPGGNAPGRARRIRRTRLGLRGVEVSVLLDTHVWVWSTAGDF